VGTEGRKKRWGNVLPALFLGKWGRGRVETGRGRGRGKNKLIRRRSRLSATVLKKGRKGGGGGDPVKTQTGRLGNPKGKKSAENANLRELTKKLKG